MKTYEVTIATCGNPPLTATVFQQAETPKQARREAESFAANNARLLEWTDSMGDEVDFDDAVVDSYEAQEDAPEVVEVRERWAFTAAEIDRPLVCHRDDQFVAWVICENFEDSDQRAPHGGVIVNRAAKATNQYADGTTGVTKEHADNVDDWLYTIDGVVADEWRDVICSDQGAFIRFAPDDPKPKPEPLPEDLGGLTEAVAIRLHDRLGSVQRLDPKDLYAAGVALLGANNPAVRALATVLSIEIPERDTDTPNRIEVEDMPEEYTEGDPLPPGEYEVAVIYKGQDNVLATTTVPFEVGDLFSLARSAWGDGEASREGGTAEKTELGNEWEQVERIVIRPQDDD